MTPTQPAADGQTYRAVVLGNLNALACENCGAIVRSTDTHDDWHSRLRTQTGPLGGFGGLFGKAV